MPTSATDIPHLAFTHHRIGIYKQEHLAANSDDQPTPLGELRPFHDLSNLPELDRKRSLGLAYLETANRPDGAEHFRAYQQRAFTLLSQVQAAGLRDSTVEAALARLVYELGKGSPAVYARTALADSTLSGQDRCNVLLMLTQAALAEDKPEEGLAFATELTTLRRHPVDWLLLADCQRLLGEDSTPSLAMAAKIDPGLTKIHKTLAAYYSAQGNPEREAWHRARAEQ
jgi:hypothetical protein